MGRTLSKVPHAPKGKACDEGWDHGPPEDPITPPPPSYLSTCEHQRLQALASQMFQALGFWVSSPLFGQPSPFFPGT